MATVQVRNHAIGTTFSKTVTRSDISKYCPRPGNIRETGRGFTLAQNYDYIILNFKFHLGLNFCVPFKMTTRNSPCGRCWQRRVAQWHLRLHCFSGPGNGGLHSFTLIKQLLKTLQPTQLITAVRYLTQGAIGLFIKEFDLIRSRAGLFVGKTPGHLSKEEQHKCFPFTFLR